MQPDSTPPSAFQSGRGDRDDVSPEATFAGRIKERREFLGMSQVELAQGLALMGLQIDPTAITRLERGDRRARLNEVVALATLLDLDLYDAIAPYPGDIAEQLDRADIAEAKAEYAATFWANELEAARRRTADLRAQLVEQQEAQRRHRERVAEGRARAEAAGDVNALAGYDVDGGADGVDPEAG